MPRRISTRSQGRALRRGSRIEGIEELEKAIERLGKVGGGPAVGVLVDGGKQMKADVLARTPRGPTGNLRKAIFLDATDPFHDPKGPSVLVGINHRIAPHWHFLELGTSKQDASPFFRPGVLKSRAQVTELIRLGLKKIVESGLPRDFLKNR
jgi:HK97 gp10 family phage protein